jgi:26S proteasome regulatory subunit N10
VYVIPSELKAQETDLNLQLALKHRQNKSQRQRIIVFTCSPIPDDEKALVKLATKMKKSSVSIDFVAFGELDDDTTKKLTAFNERVKGTEGSHMAMIPPGPGLLSDQLVTTPIMNEGGSASGGGGGDGGASEGFEFGIDPSIDPELALALRMSMEEEKARVEKANKEKAEQEAKDKAKLEGIKEEDEAAQPLLNKDGGPSGGKKEDDDADKMDTA